MIEFILNGNTISIEESLGDTFLLPYLRELGLTGSKDGCSIGACGTCTVVIDGSSKRSCRTKLSTLQGTEVITIEGLRQSDGSLHPIQQAFVDAGAIQCGFCTPGMVMTTYALLSTNPDPSEQEIKRALTGNLCRCTGYVNIIKAIRLASQEMRKA